jgi:peptide chain release factor subunit 1
MPGHQARQLVLNRLRTLREPGGALLSVVISVPPDPAELRELPARLDHLVTAAHPAATSGAAVRRDRRRAVSHVVQAGKSRGRDWFGRTIALVASVDGILEEVRLPCVVPDRATFGRRPYLRHVLRSFQQCRPYVVVVLDRRRSWLFEFSGSTVHRARRLDGEGPRAHRYAGWYGLEENRSRNHAHELAWRHYGSTIAAVEKLSAPRGRAVVVGGHADGIAEFLSVLDPALRDKIVGTFPIDPHTMTPDGVRARAEIAMARHEAARWQQVAEDLAGWEAAGVAVQGLEPSARAISESQAGLLVVRGEQMVPGWICERCGALLTRDAKCPNGDAPSYPVPDLIDEMVARVLDDRGVVDLGPDERGGLSVAVRLHRSVRAEPEQRISA